MDGELTTPIGVSGLNSHDHIPEAGLGKWFSRVTLGPPLKH